MFKKAWTFLLWTALFVVLALALWALALFQDWPWWWVPIMFAGVVTTALSVRWVSRRWHAWRLRARMRSELPRERDEQAPGVDKDWLTGVRLLRESRLSRMGSPLYVLPWFLMLGQSGSGKTRLLSQSGLTAALRPSNRRKQAESSGVLDWWFLERGVFIDPAGHLAAGSGASGAWRRLLYWLLRSRRREPLNGVVLVIDAQRLVTDTDEQLIEHGQKLRQRLDDLVQVFGARLPVYFIVTGAEAIPGFAQWGNALTPVQREQPFGLLSQQRSQGAMAFLDEMFTGLAQRLSDLRITLGLRGLPDEQAFSLPERIGDLRPRLEKLLMPAFDASPYSEPPLLSGLFLTAQGEEVEGHSEGWFSHDLLGSLIPGQRHAYQPIDSWHRWRRLMAHAAVVGWLVACGAIGTLFVYAERHTSKVLAEAASEPPKAEAFAGGLETDLDAMRRFRQALLNLTEAQQQGWRRLLPFSRHIEALQAQYRADYVRLFNSEIRSPVFDGIMSQNLRAAENEGDPGVIAAYTEFLVRRINLLDARLNNQPLGNLPLPGAALGLLYQKYGPPAQISEAQMATVGTTYRAYLEWQTDIVPLQNQRAALLVQLDSLGMENRPLSWLTAWAEQQGNLPPIQLSEYWPDVDNTGLNLSGAYTLQGHNAILGFIDELGKASRDQTLWKGQRARFLEQYQNDTQDAWYRFLQNCLISSQTRLKTRADWQETLSVVGTPNDPFFKLLHRSAERLAVIPVDRRAPWASRAIAMDRLLHLSSKDDLSAGASALSSLKITNALGGDILKGVANGGSVKAGVDVMRDEMTQAQALGKFQQLIKGVIADLQKSDAQAFQVALDTWGYGTDPAVKSSPLWEAADVRNNLIQALKGPDPREDVVWSLATGSLDFSTHYASEIAACRMESDWVGQVLSAIEGVRDPVMINELLYGERGQLPAFMAGPVKTFIQRDAQRYSGREVLGVQIPLTGAFYAYVSRMQHAQNDLVSAQRQSHAEQATEQQSKQALEVEQKMLSAQQDELKQQIAQLQATTAVVELYATPSLVNLSARSLPRQTRLTLQCSGRSTVLDNYNFPTNASFVWAPGACTDVSLEVFFANFKLVRHWAGDRGFVDFLGAFRGGQHTFTAEDFPNQRDLMASENLTHIQITYRQQGETTLLDKFAQADGLRLQVQHIDDRLKAINDQLIAMQTHAAAQNVLLAANGSKAQQGLASIRPPSEIAWCWTPRPNETAVASNDGLRLDLGIYESERRLLNLEAQLRLLGVSTQRQTVRTANGVTAQKLLVVSLRDHAAAQRVMRDISRKLGISATLEPVVAGNIDG